MYGKQFVLVLWKFITNKLRENYVKRWHHLTSLPPCTIHPFDIFPQGVRLVSPPNGGGSGKCALASQEAPLPGATGQVAQSPIENHPETGSCMVLHMFSPAFFLKGIGMWHSNIRTNQHSNCRPDGTSFRHFNQFWPIARVNVLRKFCSFIPVKMRGSPVNTYQTGFWFWNKLNLIHKPTMTHWIKLGDVSLSERAGTMVT